MTETMKHLPFLLLTVLTGIVGTTPSLAAAPQDQEFQWFTDQDWIPQVGDLGRYGHRVLVQGGSAFVSHLYRDDPATGALSKGAVIVLEQGGFSWSEIDVLQPASLIPGSRFGQALAQADDLLVVGAPLWGAPSPGPGFQAGRVYVFRRISGSWVLEDEIRAPYDQSQLGMGMSVATDGQQILVGSYTYDQSPSTLEPLGAFWVYEQDTTGKWSQIQEVLAPPHSVTQQAYWSRFATQLSLDGDTLAVCAGMSGSGALFLYERSNGVWSLDQVLEGPDPLNVERQFGYSADLDGDRLAVGAPYYLNGWSQSNGRVHFFERTSSGWVPDGFVFAPSPAANDQFGYAVALDGDRMLTGAYYTSGPGGVESGAAYMFRRDPVLGWQHEWTPTRSNPWPFEDSFGYAVALDATHGWAMVGAPKHTLDLSAGRPGSAYLYELPSSSVHCIGNLNSTGERARLSGIGSTAVGDQTHTLATRDLPANVFGIHVMGPAVTPTPLGQGSLCIGLPFTRLFPIVHSGPEGLVVLPLDWSDPLIASQVLPGSSWTFQLWYRDTVAGQLTSNLSSAATVSFD